MPAAARTCAVVAGILLAGVAVLVPAVSAHAYLASSDPAAGAVLQAAPRQVHLTFTEAVEYEYTHAQVTNRTGARVDTGQTVFPPGTSNELVVPLRVLPAGAYIVTWSTLSVDSHTEQGSYRFTVQNGTAGAPPAETLHGHGAFQFGFFLYLGLLLEVGVLVFVLAIDPARRATEAPTAPDGRLVELALFGGLAAALGSAMALADLAQRVGLSVTALALGTGVGILLLLRLVATVGVIAILLMERSRAARGLPPQARWPRMALAVGLVALVATTLSSHAAALLQDRALAMGADLLHLVAASVWLGGVASLVLLLLGADTKRAAALVRAFSPWAVASVVTLLAAGTYAAVRHLASWGQLFGTAYGQLIVAKVVLFSILVGTGSVNRYVLGPRLDRGEPAERALSRSVRIEAVLLALVLVATALLTSTATPVAAP